MPLDLASLLVSSGAMPPALADEALRRQVLLGGALDTILLELGALTERECLDRLAEVAALAGADAAFLDGVDPSVSTLLARQLAERHALLPLGARGRELRVATAYPPDTDVLEEVGFLIGRELVPQVAVEGRLRAAIARVYGLPLAPRFAALTAALDALPRQSAAETRPPPAPRPRLPEMRADDDGLDSAISRVIERAQPEPWVESDGALRLVPRVDEDTFLASPVPEAPLDPALELRSLEAARAALEKAPGRDEIVDVALRFALKTFDYAAAFAVLGGNALGWAARSRSGESTAGVEQVSVPLDVPSVLNTVLMTRGRYLGPLPEDPVSREVLAGLGRADPKVAFLYPVELRERVVAILYADSSTRRSRDRGVAEYVVFAQDIGRRFERLLVDRKRLPAAKRRTDHEPAPRFRSEMPGAHAQVPPPARPVAEPLIRRHAAAPAPPESIRLPPLRATLARPLGASRPLDDGGAFDLPELETGYPLSSMDRGTPSLVVQAMGVSRFPFRAEPEPAPPSSLPSMTELFAAADRLLDSDVAQRARALAQLQRHPEASAAALVARFPGPLLRARLPIRELPEAEELGPIPAALVRLGAPAAQALRPLLEHPDIDIRYFAVLTAGRMPVPELLAAVGQRIFDRQPAVSSAARAALAAMREVPGFEDALGRLRKSVVSLHSDVAGMAARALGTLRDVECVDALIGLTGHPDKSLNQAAADALREITKQSFGPSRRRWQAWWAEHRGDSRMAWLIEGLRHSDLDLRLSAIDELVRTVGDNFGYYADAPLADRETAASRWGRWWKPEAS